MSPKRVPGIDEHSVISGNAEIAFTRLDDDWLAMDENAGECYSLNVSAARIWELISPPRSVDSICAVLCREFAVDPEICLQDVFEVLDAMRAAGLVKVSDAAVD